MTAINEKNLTATPPATQRQTECTSMKSVQKALVTGVTGQDGSYLAELLLSKGYEVYGLVRETSTDNLQRLREANILEDSNFRICYGDLTDASRMQALVSKIKPSELYNLAAQSHVGQSFDSPRFTAEVNAIGTLNILEAVRQSNQIDKCKIYQASTSELYGKVQESRQSETTPFYPRSPYAVAKLFSYWMVKNYREAYGMFCSNGILFNHESPRRGLNFVTRKITNEIVKIALGSSSCLYLGNLNAKRDWGHAREYVDIMWQVLQSDRPDDYVVATGKYHSVREFVTLAAEMVGIQIEFKGEGLEEVGYISVLKKNLPHLKVGQEIVKVSEDFFRPSEVDELLGDATKIMNSLKVTISTTIDQLCEEMITAEYKRLATELPKAK